MEKKKSHGSSKISGLVIPEQGGGEERSQPRRGGKPCIAGVIVQVQEKKKGQHERNEER